MIFRFVALILCLSTYFLSALSTELQASPSKKQLTYPKGAFPRSRKLHNGPDLSRMSVKQTSSTQRNSVFFTADDSAILFVNGVFQYGNHWPDVAFREVSLKDGDVVSIIAQNFDDLEGVVAVINFSGKRIPTGGPGWKAIKGHGPKSWMLPEYSACSWPDPVVVFFGIRVDATYVWAEGGRRPGGGTISLRYTIGETCPVNSKISFASVDAASLYVNGVLIRSINNSPTFISLTHLLKIGDVVSIIASNRGGGFGAIAAIEYWGRKYVTGRADYKAVKAFSIQGGNSNAWMLPEYSSCRWGRAVSAPLLRHGAPSFPSSTGAFFVWASDAGGKDRIGEKDRIFIRFVVGGELC